MVRVLFSIKPKYCKLIAEGKKTLEIRKTIPIQWKKLYESNDILVPDEHIGFIYCTKAKTKEEQVFVNGKCINGTVFASFDLRQIDKYAVDENVRKYVFNSFATNKENTWVSNILWRNDEPMVELELFTNSCLEYEDIVEYAGNGFTTKPVYAIHIDNLELYRSPKTLEEFKVKRPPQSWQYI